MWFRYLPLIIWIGGSICIKQLHDFGDFQGETRLALNVTVLNSVVLASWNNFSSWNRHRMNCLNAGMEESAYIIRKNGHKSKYTQLSDFIFWWLKLWKKKHFDMKLLIKGTLHWSRGSYFLLPKSERRVRRSYTCKSSLFVCRLMKLMQCPSHLIDGSGGWSSLLD